MTREQRRHRREKITAEVYYQNAKKQLAGGCTAKDISEGGVCIRIKEFFPVGTILELHFQLPLSLEIFDVKGRIMWINKTPYNEQWEAGLEILEDRDYRRLIQQYIFLKNPTDLENS